MKNANKKIKRKRKQPAVNNDLVCRSTDLWEGLDDFEQTSIVCNLICKGWTFSQIAECIKSKYRASSFGRESAYPIFRKAAKKGWVEYVPPTSYILERQLKERFPWLRGIRVVHTSQFEDVACCGAEILLDLLENYRHQNRSEVHIGFAGGHAMRKLAQVFAELLSRSNGRIPNRVILHAVVAGFDVHEPTTDPNTFFTLFHTGSPFDIEFQYVGLHTPPVVQSDQYKLLRNEEGIRESYEQAHKIDIIVTSATNWSDEDSTFRKYMEKSEDCSETLQSASCIGDMLWLPLGSDEPIRVKTKIRAMTLMELDDLPNLIMKGKYIVLVLGPCSKCNRTKANILAAILNQKKQMITHLIADSRSVREMLSGRYK